jgi:hypothetical protein
VLSVAQMSKKTRTIVGRCAAVLALISWISFFELYIYLDYTRPHNIDVGAGRVYSLNNHGSIAYLTRAEHVFLYAFAYAAGVLVLLAAVLYNGTRAANAERLRK